MSQRGSHMNLKAIEAIAERNAREHGSAATGFEAVHLMARMHRDDVRRHGGRCTRGPRCAVCWMAQCIEDAERGAIMEQGDRS